MRNSYDVVVIGSGFGGAVMACRLAQAGCSVAVLERGRRWEAHEFPRSIGQVSEAFWQEGRSHGFLEYLAFRKLDVIQGAGVGGGSLHYFNVNLRATPEIFEKGGWPTQINRDSLDPYYGLAEAMLESRPLRPPAGYQQLPTRSTVFLDAARTAGYTAEQVPIAVYTDVDRLHPAGGTAQSACTYCGNCLFGCHLHAKNTLDINYLALAERHHGAEIFALHEVKAILPLPDGRYDVQFRRMDPDPTLPSTEGSVQATRVVVSGGALGSTRLLLSCRDRTKSLPKLSPALGDRFSVNGELLFARAQDTTVRVDPGLGPPITAMTTVKTATGLVTVQDLGLPDPFLWFLEGAMPPRLARLRRILAFGGAYLKRSFGMGRPTSRIALGIDALVSGGRTPHSIPFLGMGTDSADGRMRLRGEDLDILWSARRNRSLYRSLGKVMEDISRAAGGHFVGSFLSRWPLRKTLTAHPLGGCPMGQDPRTSLVNHLGGVWGYPNLYVVDGSVIPTALALNPSLTIAALAERCAFWITHDREMSQDDPETPANRAYR